MTISFDINQIKLNRPVATIGFFDGVHLGHTKILETAVQKAKEMSRSSLLITFWPHPRIVLNKDAENLKILTTLEEKQRLIGDIGFDNLLVLNFTPSFAKQAAHGFIKDFLISKLNISAIVLGHNHTFGNMGKGNFQLLRQMELTGDYQAYQIEPIKFDSISISSTKIRAALENGLLNVANSMLGRPYSITGTIEGGQQIGRSIGYPTANISPTEPLKQIPKIGVYAVWVDFQGASYPAMLNVGIKPTLGNGLKLTIEAHIIGFNQNIYDQQITVRFMEKIRNEERFQSLDLLKEQLAKDKVKAQELLGCKST